MPEEPKYVLCIGDLVADIVATPVTRLPEQGDSVVTDRIAVFPGGNALNAAVALRRMGDPVAMTGSVGDDDLGTVLLDQLRDIGLDVRGVRRESGGATPVTFIMRAEGEDRRFISALGVGADFTGEEVPHDLIPRDGIVLVGAYLKLPAWNDDALIDMLQCARERGSRVVLNVCVVRNNGVDPRRCLALLPYVDVFLPNEDEARAITGEETPALQARALRGAGARVVIITRGAKGLYAEDDTQVVTMGAYPVQVVDPSGCGDCFTAGLLAALRRGWDTVAMLKLGSAVGALGATALGCTSGVPSFGEIERFLEENTVDVSTHPSVPPLP
jgi:sugar/nucleoside kinase (ribokinase family)